MRSRSRGVKVTLENPFHHSHVAQHVVATEKSPTAEHTATPLPVCLVSALSRGVVRVKEGHLWGCSGVETLRKASTGNLRGRGGSGHRLVDAVTGDCRQRLGGYVMLDWWGLDIVGVDRDVLLDLCYWLWGRHVLRLLDNWGVLVRVRSVVCWGSGMVWWGRVHWLVNWRGGVYLVVLLMVWHGRRGWMLLGRGVDLVVALVPSVLGRMMV